MSAFADSKKPIYEAYARMTEYEAERNNLPGEWTRETDGQLSTRWKHPWVSDYRMRAIQCVPEWVHTYRYLGNYSKLYYDCHAFFDCQEDLDRFIKNHPGKWSGAFTVLKVVIPKYWQATSIEYNKWASQLKSMGVYEIQCWGEYPRDVEGKPRVSYHLTFLSLAKASAVFDMYSAPLYAKHWHVECWYITRLSDLDRD